MILLLQLKDKSFVYKDKKLWSILRIKKKVFVFAWKL